MSRSPHSLPPDVPALIIGAGSAGSAAALCLSQAGLSPLVLDKHPEVAEAGARWVNGIHFSAFDIAKIARPQHPELHAFDPRFHLIAGYGPTQIAVRDTGLLEVDMRHLIARLQRDATQAGATFRGGITVHALELGRAQTSAGPVQAPLIIDASGLGGLFSKQKPRPSQVCAAAQGVYAVTDLAAAHAYFARLGVSPGDTACFSAIAGGYSIVNLRLAGDTLAILTGSLPALGHPSGRALRDDFARAHPWVGPLLFGGAAPIPLARPRRLVPASDTHRALIRLGDAASMVFSAHGSGVGAQLVAARLLADALALRNRPFGEAARRWERQWKLRFLPLFSSAFALTRMATKFTPAQLGWLIRHRLLTASALRLGFRAGL